MQLDPSEQIPVLLIHRPGIVRVTQMFRHIAGERLQERWIADENVKTGNRPADLKEALSISKIDIDDGSVVVRHTGLVHTAYRHLKDPRL